MEPVRSHRSKLVVEAARLHRARFRRDEGKTLLEGPRLVQDAIEAGCRVRRLFAAPDDSQAREVARSHGLELVMVDERALQRVAGTKSPRGPVAAIDIPAEVLDPERDVLVSWGVSDPGNVGTLIRTAASFGWGYAYTQGSADPWSPKTLRAGAGGQFQTSVKGITGLSELDAWSTVATVVRGGEDPSSIGGENVAVLIGEEAQGLPSEVVAACSATVTVSTPGDTESLNAAVAAGILVYELSRSWRETQSNV